MLFYQENLIIDLKNYMKIISTKKTRISKWVSLINNLVEEKKKKFEYHSLKINDYASIIAITQKNEIVLVEQFRPAVNKKTLELPGGIVEKNNSPIDVAKRELLEETGFKVNGKLEKLGKIDIDYGRISNKAYGFFAKNVIFDELYNVEENIKTILMPKKKFFYNILNNNFNHSPHLSFVLIAKMKNLF
tara:strand:- start:2677 stop:3243 length:567 start_codon:yes stop_codon:yes gene_type:complete